MKIVDLRAYQNRAQSNGTLWIENCAAACLNCTFLDNAAQVSGGGIYSGVNSALVLRDNLFERNSGPDGAAIMSDHSQYTHMINCTVRNNQPNLVRGAVYYYESTGNITQSTITLNGAIGMIMYQSTVFLTYSEISLNSGTGIGVISATAELDNCVIVGNFISNPGGGIHIGTFPGNSTVKASNTIISENSGNGGGGVYLYSDFPQYSGNLYFFNVTCTNNQALGTGGCIYARSGTNVYVSASRINNNIASEGAGIFINTINPSQFLFEDSEAIGNTGTSNAGGGIYAKTLSSGTSLFSGGSTTKSVFLMQPSYYKGKFHY